MGFAVTKNPWRKLKKSNNKDFFLQFEKICCRSICVEKKSPKFIHHLIHSWIINNQENFTFYKYFLWCMEKLFIKFLIEFRNKALFQKKKKTFLSVCFAANVLTV